MSGTVNIPVTMHPVKATHTFRRRRVLFYSLFFVLIQYVGVLLPLWIGSTEWFLKHNDYPVFRMSGYGSRIKGKNCQILISGDSVSLSGVDPRIIQARTGLSSCNVGEFINTTNFVGGTYPLDQYLAHNARPEYLVNVMSATWFAPERPELTRFTMEGVMYAFQYRKGLWIWKVFARKPGWMFEYSNFVVQQLAYDLAEYVRATHAERWRIDDRGLRDHQAGLWLYPNPPQTRCERGVDDPVSTHALNAASVQTFRAHYSLGGTRVLVDVSPAAQCDQSLESYKGYISGLNDNQFTTLPIRDFAVGDVHFSREGEQRFSEMIADQLVQRMQQDGVRPQNALPSSQRPVLSR